MTQSLTILENLDETRGAGFLPTNPVTRAQARVYISHRIREVQAIADRLTVLRDGEWQGTYDTKKLDEDQIVSLIVGQDLAGPSLK